MKRKYSAEHDRWHRRVEGQIRHTMGQHPEWFNFKDSAQQETCINSLAKRIVGEIVVAVQVTTKPDGGLHCAPTGESVTDAGECQSQGRDVPLQCVPALPFL